MQHVSGIIIVVQEGRFRLAADDGRSILFTLHHGASIEAQDLEDLLGGCRVEVAFKGAKFLTTQAAHEIRIAGPR